MANPAEVKEALLKALNNNDVPPEILVKWFDRKMEPAAKEALSAEDVSDVNKNLVSEKEYNELEEQVKDSLLKQKASLQSEFSKMLTQVNLKDPEEAKKMFPPEITKQFDENLTKELEKATQEAQKQSAKEENYRKTWKNVSRALLLLLGTPELNASKEEKNYFDTLMEFSGLKDNMKEKLKKYNGLVSWKEQSMVRLMGLAKSASEDSNPDTIKKEIERLIGSVWHKDAKASEQKKDWLENLNAALKANNINDQKFEELYNEAVNKKMGMVASEDKTSNPGKQN